MNRAFVLFAIMFALLAAPVMADGNVTLNATDIAPTHINTDTPTAMLNISVNITPGAGTGHINITTINITLSGNSTKGNVSKIEIKNSTNDVIGSATSNIANITSTVYRVSLTRPIFLNASNATQGPNQTITIYLNTSKTNATLGSAISLTLNRTLDILTTNGTDGIDITGTNISLASQMQDVHGTVAMSPTNVDTGIINQTFVYNITNIARDRVELVNITIPSEYAVVNVTNATIAGTACQSVHNPSPTCSVSFSTNRIELNATTDIGTTGDIKITFDVNASLGEVGFIPFNSTLSGSNITAAETDHHNHSIFARTAVLLNVTNVTVAKSTAVVNGSDYWEFNFTVTFLQNVSGRLQFKMDPWNNSDGHLFNLTDTWPNITNSTTHYATIRNETIFNTTGKVNVTDFYNSGPVSNNNATEGISYTQQEDTSVTMILRMVIPAGTPISDTWNTVYSMIFRSEP